MAVSYVIGKSLVSEGEFEEKLATGRLREFSAERLKKPRAARLAVAGREIAADEITSMAEAVSGAGFRPIDIGRPLSIEIMTIYSGDAPLSGPLGLGGPSDLLVTSAVKSLVTFKAAPRAINQLIPRAEDKRHYVPSALRDGSTIVYYTPALVMGTTLSSFELVADTFDRQIISDVARLFSSAAGLPIFAPASTYLLAGSILLKIFADLSDAFESPPFLHADWNLRLDTPELPSSVASHVALYNDRDRNEFVDHGAEFRDGKLVLVDEKTGDTYDGDAPYMIASIDGRVRTGLEKFKSTHASAAMLERFYGKGDRAGTVVDALGDALGLYNDFTSRKQVDNLKKRLDLLKKAGKEGSEEFKQLEKLRAAHAANIQNTELQVKG